MAIFDQLDWTRLDVWAIVVGEGIALVAENERDIRTAWLRGEGYEILNLDFAGGLDRANRQFDSLVDWEGQFGYAPKPGPHNLNALRDGFEFPTSKGAGCVLEILGAEAALSEDSGWFKGFLSIASEYSLREIAQGRRFFVLLITTTDSKIEGIEIETKSLPGRFRGR